MGLHFSPFAARAGGVIAPRGRGQAGSVRGFMARTPHPLCGAGRALPARLAGPRTRRRRISSPVRSVRSSPTTSRSPRPVDFYSASASPHGREAEAYELTSLVDKVKAQHGASSERLRGCREPQGLTGWNSRSLMVLLGSSHRQSLTLGWSARVLAVWGFSRTSWSRCGSRHAVPVAGRLWVCGRSRLPLQCRVGGL